MPAPSGLWYEASYLSFIMWEDDKTKEGKERERYLHLNKMWSSSFSSLISKLMSGLWKREMCRCILSVTVSRLDMRPSTQLTRSRLSRINLGDHQDVLLQMWNKPFYSFLVSISFLLGCLPWMSSFLDELSMCYWESPPLFKMQENTKYALLSNSQTSCECGVAFDIQAYPPLF